MELAEAQPGSSPQFPPRVLEIGSRYARYIHSWAKESLVLTARSDDPGLHVFDGVIIDEDYKPVANCILLPTPPDNPASAIRRAIEKIKEYQFADQWVLGTRLLSQDPDTKEFKLNDDSQLNLIKDRLKRAFKIFGFSNNPNSIQRIRLDRKTRIVIQADSSSVSEQDIKRLDLSLVERVAIIKGDEVLEVSP